MDPIKTFEIVIILPMLLVGMILIDIQLLKHELVIIMDMINLLIVAALHIKVLDTQYDVEANQPLGSYFPNYGSSS